MKKTIKFLSATVVSAFLFVGAASCKTIAQIVDSSTENLSHQISLFNENLDIALYESKQIDYTCDTDVTFVSKNSTVVSVDKDGVVTALKVGTAEVEISNAYDVATVTYRVIDTGDAPYLELNIEETSINLTVNDTVDLVGTLSFRGEVVESEIVFSSNSGCVTVTGDGKLTAVAEGTATITAQTTFFLQEVVAQLVVNVVENSVFLCDVADRYTLCTWSENGEETVSLPTEVNDNGTIKSVDFAYSYDETLLKNTGNEFSLKDKTYEGIIPVTMRYTGNNKVYDFIVCIHSEYKRVDLTNSDTIYRVGSAGYVEDYAPKFMAEINGQKAVKIFVGGMDLDYDSTSHTYNVDKVSNGVMRWDVVTATGILYEIKVNVSDFVLNTPEDVHAVLPIITSQTVYLGRDIDMKGSKPYKVDPSLQTASEWFSGVLDGQGYTIKNLVMDGTASNGGLFYTFLGTVKNIALTNVDVSTSDSSYANSVIGFHAGGVLENVYIDAFSTTNGIVSGIFTYFRPNREMEMRNVVVKFDNRATQTDKASAIVARWNTIENDEYEYFILENVYAISNAGLIEASDYNPDNGKDKIDRFTKLTSTEIIEKLRNDEIQSEKLDSFLRANFDYISVDLTDSTNYYVESGILQNGTVVENHLPKFDEKVNNMTGKIVSIKDGTVVLKDGENAQLETSNLVAGTRVWTVAYDTGESYLVTVNVVNAILKTANEVLSVLPQATSDRILLGNDIDFNGVAYTTSCERFSGVFDGQGYAIRNVKMERAFFDQIDAEGTIRNLQFIDVTIGAAWRAVIANHASGIIENIFIKANDGGYENTAGLFSSFRSNIPLTMRNIVVVFDATKATSAVCASWNDTKNENDTCFNWENIYVISNVGFVANSDDNPSLGSPITKMKRVTESQLIQKVKDGQIAEQLETLIRKNYDCDVCDLTTTTNYYVELGKYVNGNAIDGHTPMFNEKIDGTTGNIVSIKDGITEIKASAVAPLDVSGLTLGKRVWTVKYDTGNSYLVTVNLVNIILRTSDDVLNILPSIYHSAEYIALGNTIDMTGKEYSNGGNNVFYGNLDGQGYAIENLTLKTSLFAGAAGNFEMRNIALTNVTIVGNTVAVIAKNGQGKFENVFIQANATGTINAGIFTNMYGGTNFVNFTMTNVAVIFNNPNNTTSTSNDSAAIVNAWGGMRREDFEFTNVYIVSNHGMMDGIEGTENWCNATKAADIDIATRLADGNELSAKVNDAAIKDSVLAKFISKYVAV